MNYNDLYVEPPIDFPFLSDLGEIDEDYTPNVTSCRDMLQGALEAMYETGNVELLEHCIEELCAEFGLSLPEGPLKIKPQGK